MAGTNDLRVSGDLSASALTAQDDRLLQHAKIAKAGKDFESILLGNWLQAAEQSFAKVPGGDGDNEDSSSGQFQGIAVQALAGSLTASGGIGIARMITHSLQGKTNSERPGGDG